MLPMYLMGKRKTVESLYLHQAGKMLVGVVIVFIDFELVCVVQVS